MKWLTCFCSIIFGKIHCFYKPLVDIWCSNSVIQRGVNRIVTVFDPPMEDRDQLKSGFKSRYYQICAIFLYFLLNFPLLFFLGGSPASIKWPSHVLYGKFAFSFTHLPYRIFLIIRFFLHQMHVRQLAQWQDARMPCGRPGFNSPQELPRLFHLSQISKVDISGKSTDTYT